MARGKKKENLTLEEKLEQALVPVEEQPYEVPKNWCWLLGKTIFTGMESKKPKGDMFQYIDIESIDNENQKVTEPKIIPVSKAPSRASRKLHYGDTVFSLVRPYLKNIAYIDETLKDCIASTGFYVCSPQKAVDSKYIYYLMISPYVVDGLNSFMKGDNSPSIRKDDIEKYAFPVPPLAEQQRIVEQIESLFSKLDEAKERVQEALDNFKARKSAIIHMAFNGELTSNWRREHKVNISMWENAPFDDCVKKMQNGLAKRSGTEGKPFAVLRLANLSDDSIDTQDLREILLNEKEQNNYSLYPNDVLMIRVNGSKDNVGKQYLVQGEYNWAFCDHIIRIIYNRNVLPQYMLLFSKSEKYRLYVKENMVSSAGQNTISRKGMANLLIPIPPLDEQKEIVRILNKALSEETIAFETAQNVISKIDIMKKSILAKAFRGELGTNNPEEESSIELLKEILNSDN